MNQTEYNRMLSQLPEHLIKEYGFNPPFDYSRYKCIHTSEYDYYPELDCCIIDDIPIVWTDGNPWVTPEKPEILAGFKRRITQTVKTIKVVYAKHKDCPISCYDHPACEPHISYMKRQGCTSFMMLDNEKVYYNPNDIDLPNEPETITLVRCLFYAQNHESIGLIPNRSTPPDKWELTEFVGGKNNG